MMFETKNAKRSSTFSKNFKTSLKIENRHWKINMILKLKKWKQFLIKMKKCSMHESTNNSKSIKFWKNRILSFKNRNLRRLLRRVKIFFHFTNSFKEMYLNKNSLREVNLSFQMKRNYLKVGWKNMQEGRKKKNL